MKGPPPQGPSQILCRGLSSFFHSDLWNLSWGIQTDSSPVTEQWMGTAYSQLQGRGCFSQGSCPGVAEKSHPSSPSHVAFEQRPDLSPEPTVPLSLPLSPLLPSPIGLEHGSRHLSIEHTCRQAVNHTQCLSVPWIVTRDFRLGSWAQTAATQQTPSPQAN